MRQNDGAVGVLHRDEPGVFQLPLGPIRRLSVGGVKCVRITPTKLLVMWRLCSVVSVVRLATVRYPSLSMNN